MRLRPVLLMFALAAAHRPLDEEDLRIAPIPDPDEGDYNGRQDGEGRRVGQGNLTWEDGSGYSGGWAAGLMEGQGMLLYMVGDYQARYDGSWSGGKPVSLCCCIAYIYYFLSPP